MENIYTAVSGALNTTAAPVRVATGTAIKTLLQLTAASTSPITIISWAISFDGVTASAVPVPVELIETTTVAGGSPTAVTPTLFNYSANAQASNTTAGFAPTSEGTVVATTRLLDYVDLTPNGGVYVHDFPLGREPVVLGSRVLRVRTTSAATVNAVARITWSE